MLIMLAILVLTDILNRRGIYIRKSIICQPLIVRWTVMISVIIIIATIIQKVVMNALFNDGDENNSKKIQRKLKKSKYSKEVA